MYRIAQIPLQPPMMNGNNGIGDNYAAGDNNDYPQAAYGDGAPPAPSMSLPSPSMAAPGVMGNGGGGGGGDFSGYDMPSPAAFQQMAPAPPGGDPYASPF